MSDGMSHVKHTPYAVSLNGEDYTASSRQEEKDSFLAHSQLYKQISATRSEPRSAPKSTLRSPPISPSTSFRKSRSEQDQTSEPVFKFLSGTAHTCTLATIVCFFIFIWWLSSLYFLPIVRKADVLADKAILLVDDASSQLVFVDEARAKLVFFESMAVNISELAVINNNRAAGLEVDMKASLKNVNSMSTDAQKMVVTTNQLSLDAAQFLEASDHALNSTLHKMSITIDHVNQVSQDTNILVGDATQFLKFSNDAVNSTLVKMSTTINTIEDTTMQILSHVNKTFTQRNADLLTIIHDAQTIINELNKTLYDMKKTNQAASEAASTDGFENPL